MTGGRVADATILIVAYRARQTAPRLAAALDALTVKPAAILILENGSPEDERVDPADLPEGAELIVSEDNLGFAAGNNRLAERAETEWLVLLNPDAFPRPDWLAELLAAAERHSDADLFGSTQWAADAPGVLDGAGDVMLAFGVPYRGGYGKRMDPPAEGEVFAPCGAAMMVRRDVFAALGGFDEDYFCYVEDVDLGYRARLAGRRVIQVSAAQVDHVGYGATGRRSEFATYHGVRNRFWCFFKNTPGWLVWALAPVHLALTAVFWLSAARFGHFGLFGRALRDALAGWPRLMEKRRAVQSRRAATVGEIARALAWNPMRLLTRAPDVRGDRG
ncbi:glycosyltransferase family 2 protein [Marinicauda salina]|uniref:Glycosyltransferase family 2 protein n=1 Tax=Marinicauda salina TaxID=2135793 RepID=A0A2U2BXG7_9PROT|nr:glycosyltransferase family 2 protein [Marinicauda salina]PWE18705.1 glycosyltransferase family 2 protein [Marinicauda salina]